MSIGKISKTIAIKMAKAGKETSEQIVKKAKPMVEQGEKKLTTALDSLASTMKAKVNQTQNKRRMQKELSERFAKQTLADTTAKIANDLKTQEINTEKIQATFNLNKTNQLEALTEKSVNKSAKESAEVFIDKFEKENGNKLTRFVSGEKANKSASGSAVIFELNGKTETEKMLDQKDLKEKLMDKFGDKLNENKKIRATKARLQEKYKK